MKVLNLKAQAVMIDDGNILASVKNGSFIKLIRLKLPKLSIEQLYTFNGMRSLLLSKIKDLYMISINENLLVSRDLVEWKSVLKLKPNNIIWHACETPEGIVVQEYGESPTGLYLSNNGLEWACTITNRDVDPKSKHFHYVAYDQHRDLLYATLGDGNIIRAIELRKNKWRPIYKGAWQFLPIYVMKDKTIFGFDSGIAKGGIGIYMPEEGKWKFTFLKYKGAKVAQMSELIYSNGLWIAALGAPQAIVFSKDLKLWYPIYIEGYGNDFNHNMSVKESDDLIVGATGSSLMLLEKEETISSNNVIMEPYMAVLDKVKGIIFNLKRIKEL